MRKSQVRLSLKCHYSRNTLEHAHEMPTNFMLHVCTATDKDGINKPGRGGFQGTVRLKLLNSIQLNSIFLIASEAKRRRLRKRKRANTQVILDPATTLLKLKYQFFENLPQANKTLFWT